MLLGRSGAGKSAVGNDILGQEEFESRPESLTAITQECEKKKAVVEGRRVSYFNVDLFAWFNFPFTCFNMCQNIKPLTGSSCLVS